MTIEEIYRLAIEMGIEADPRGANGVKKALERVKREYEGLSAGEKKEFDRERLTNPYSDTRILYGDKSGVVDKILAGIDIEVGEIILADRLNDKGEGVDMVLAHHPAGSAYAALAEVMDLQIDFTAELGVPVNVAESLLRDRIGEVDRSISGKNHFQNVDCARVLNLPFVCAHTPLDNLGYKLVTDLVNKKDPETVGDVLALLKEIPEFKKAVVKKAGPKLFAGREKSRCGKVVVGEFTGGTEGAKKLYEWLSRSGVGTIIGMHMSEGHRVEAKKHHINVVIAGHMASDSIGVNLFLDELVKKGVGVIPCSGLIRVSRI